MVGTAEFDQINSATWTGCQLEFIFELPHMSDWGKRIAFTTNQLDLLNNEEWW